MLMSRVILNAVLGGSRRIHVFCNDYSALLVFARRAKPIPIPMKIQVP